ncbi:MAG TPA: 2-dehydropantoate 2-reductase [Steroidobacteraceae bacterium]|nr:2-dehydropantoate 2-reductase [Steroidobacteraceae bacterium]
MRVCIAGVGAVGATVAARLAASSADVRLIARGARLEDLRRNGLRVAFDGEERLCARLPASDRPSEFGIQDVLIVAVKAYSLPQLLPELAPLVGPQTAVAPLVNGIPWWYFQGNSGPGAGDAVHAVDPGAGLRDRFAAASIVGCVAYLTSRLAPDGWVIVSGTPRLHIRDIDGPAREHTRRLAALLSAAGIATQVSERIRAELWTKIALNAATNPLSVISGATLVEQFTDARLLPIVRTVLEETGRVARAYGIAPAMALEEMLATGRRAGPFETSMLQDFRAGRPLELGAIGDALLELAAKIGEEMPTTRRLVGLCAYLGARR